MYKCESVTGLDSVGSKTQIMWKIINGYKEVSSDLCS